MGSCITSMMDSKGQKSLIEDPTFAARLKYGPVNVKITEDEADRSGIYRCANITAEEHNHFFNDFYAKENLLQQLEFRCKAHPEQRAIAYRKVEKVTKEQVKDDKGRVKDWEFLHMSSPNYITYGEFWKKLLAFGKGMAELGVRAGGKVALYEDTRWEWVTSCLGLWTQNITTVTVYANLGQDGLLYALKEAECLAVVCNGSNVKKLMEVTQQESSLANFIIIYLDELPADVQVRDHQIVSWKSVVERGEASDKPHVVTTNPDEPLLIMYTSGTVAEPKGVIHTIGSLTHSVHFLTDRLRELLGQEPDETFVSYLPAAHIFEFVCEMLFLTGGHTLLCFGSPRTLTDVSARPCGDIACYKPFFLIAVPRILETIKKAIEAKLPPPGSFKRKVFNLAYQRRRDALLQGKDTPYWNEKVFKIPRAMMGGKMRAICSGGAPLADTTQEWITTVLGIPVAQGYGMTEACCNACVQRTGELTCVAGQLLRGMEMRLLDTEEYKHTDQPNARGEMLIRGNCLFKGYYKQEQNTKDCMLPGGWLRTGDVAEVSAKDHQVYIVGRVKALAKNLLGEYIALEQLEAIYGQHPVCTPNGACVLVHTQRTYITALMLTDEDKTMKWAATNNIAGSWPEILDRKEFLDAVTKSCQDLAKKANKKPFELVKFVKVLNDEWTPENGLTTASMKLRRNKIDERYAAEIAELFKAE